MGITCGDDVTNTSVAFFTFRGGPTLSAQQRRVHICHRRGVDGPSSQGRTPPASTDDCTRGEDR